MNALCFIEHVYDLWESREGHDRLSCPKTNETNNPPKRMEKSDEKVDVSRCVKLVTLQIAELEMHRNSEL